MADLEQTSLQNSEAGEVVTVDVLTVSDAFAYSPGYGQVMLLQNTTGSPVSPIITGESPRPEFSVKGVGDIDLTGGYAVGPISDGDMVAVNLDSLEFWMEGSRAFITNGTGLLCSIITEREKPNQKDLLFIDGGRLVAGGKLTKRSRLWG